jgi:hypothetical protein
MKRIAKIPLYILLLVLIVVLAIAYVYYFTTLPESELNNYVRGLVGRSTSYEVSFQKVNRDIWNRLVLEGVEVIPRDGSSPAVAYVSKIELEYDIFDLLRQDYDFKSLEIDSIFARIPEGGFDFPSRPKDRPAQKPAGPSIEFDKINIRTAAVALNDTDLIAISSLRGSFSMLDDSLAVALDSIRADWSARGIALHSLRGNLYSSGKDRYRVDSLVAAVGNSHVTVNGTTGASFTSGLDLNYDLNPIDLEDIRRLTGVKLSGVFSADGTLRGAVGNFESEAVINGTFLEKPFENVETSFSYTDERLNFSSIHGEIFRALFDGSGSLDFGVKPEEYSYVGLVRHLDLREIGPALKTDFTGDVSMSGSGFNPKNFRMAIDGDLDSVRVDIYYFDHVSGSVEFDLEKIKFLPGFQGRYKDTYVRAGGVLEYQGDLDITGSAEFQDLTDFSGQTFLRELGGRGMADFHATGPTLDFAVRGSFESDSFWTYGLETGYITVQADLKSFVSHRVGRVSGYWTGGAAYSVPVDSGRFESVVSGERVFLEYVSVNGPQGSAIMYGEYDGTSIPPTFYADTLYGSFAGNRFFSRKPVALDIIGNVTRFRQAVMGLDTGSIIAAGDITNDTLADAIYLNLDIDAVDFQIQPIVEQFYRDKEISGRWWGEARLRGDFEKPKIDFKIVIDSLSIDTVAMGSLHAMLHYDAGYLYSDSTRLGSEYGEYLFSGKLPLDLSFAEVANRLPEAPIDFQMIASGNRLVLGEVFVPNIESFETDFYVETHLIGTYAEPNIDGWGYFINGEMKVLDLVNPLTDVRAYFRMRNETIYIDSAIAHTPGGEEWTRGLEGLLTGRDKDVPRSRVSASGTMRLITLGVFDYDISVDGENVFFISDSYDVQGLADADLHVIGSTPPTVAGDIILMRLDVRDEFEAFIPPDLDTTLVLEDSTIWDLNLNIRANNNLWIRNSDVEAELKGDVFVERVVGRLNMLGTLETIRRGRYYLLTVPFNIESGTMTFNNVAVINPEIDFVITKRLRSQAGQIGAPSPQEVELHITGTLLEPTIDVAEGSALTREELLASLLAGSEFGQLGSQGGSSFSRSLVRSALPALTTAIGPLSGQFVEELEISPTAEGETYQISVAKYVSNSLYVRYSQKLADVSGRTIGIEYYLGDNVTFTVSKGLIEGTTDNAQGISFDINLNFEY